MKMDLLSNILLVAFGMILVFIFLTIEVYGVYGVEANAFLRWVELFMGVPIVILGVWRFVGRINE